MTPHDMTSLNERLTGLMCTWAILASSWSFLSLFSFCCMKSLSIVLCPCMLYSLLVKSIPLCSSFTSNKTLSRETEEYRERIHLLRSFRHVLSKLDVWANTICPVYCKHKQIYKSHTCCSFLHIVQLIVEERHLLVFFLHYICNIVQKSDLAVCWFSI